MIILRLEKQASIGMFSGFEEERQKKREREDSRGRYEGTGWATRLRKSGKRRFKGNV